MVSLRENSKGMAWWSASLMWPILKEDLHTDQGVIAIGKWHNSKWDDKSVHPQQHKGHCLINGIIFKLTYTCVTPLQQPPSTTDLYYLILIFGLFSVFHTSFWWMYLEEWMKVQLYFLGKSFVPGQKKCRPFCKMREQQTHSPISTSRMKQCTWTGSWEVIKEREGHGSDSPL